MAFRLRRCAHSNTRHGLLYRLSRLCSAPLDEFSPPVRRIVAVETSSALFIAAFTCLTAPFMGLVLRGELGATPFQLAVVSSAGPAFMLPSLWWARAIRGRFPLPYVVWPGFAARGVFLLALVIHSAWPLVGVLAASSLLAAIAGPAYSALVRAVYPREQRGHALGVVRMAGSMLGIGLSPIAGMLLGLVHFRTVFAVAAVLGMAGSLCQRGMSGPNLLRTTSAEPDAVGNLWSVLDKDRPFRRLLMVSFVFGLGIWLQTPANPLMFVDVLHATGVQVGVAAAVAGIVGVFGNSWWGRLVDRRSSVQALRVVYMLGMCTPLIYLVGFVARTPWILVATSISDSLMATGLDIVAMMAVLDIARPTLATRYMAIYLTCAGARGVIGPVLGALVIHYAGLGAVYVMAAGIMLCAAWVAAHQPRVDRIPVPSPAVG